MGLFLCQGHNEQGQVKIPTLLEWCFPIVSKRACISFVLTLSCLLIGQLCPSSLVCSHLSHCFRPLSVTLVFLEYFIKIRLEN